jgi:hypothetical protein
MRSGTTVSIKSRVAAAAVGTASMLLPLSTAAVGGTGTPDWPCVQRKVEVLTSTQVWDGPPVEDVKGWNSVPEVSRLVQKLSNRRVPIEEAQAAIKAFAETLPEAKRNEQLILVFAGFFDTLNNQRKSVIHGIEKYLKAQQERSAELERQGEEIAKLEKKAASDETAAAELGAARERFDWAQRIFNERQTSIPIACEVPVSIDERIFGIARSIRALMTAS